MVVPAPGFAMFTSHMRVDKSRVLCLVTVLACSTLAACGQSSVPPDASDPCRRTPSQPASAALPDIPSEFTFDLNRGVEMVVEASDAILVEPAGSRDIVAYDANALQRRWKYSPEDAQSVWFTEFGASNFTLQTEPPIRVAGDVVLLAVDFPGRDEARGGVRVDAVDLGTGTRRWSIGNPGSDVTVAYSDACSVVVIVKTVANMTIQSNELKGLDRNSGAERWQVALPPTPYQVSGAYGGWLYLNADDTIMRVNTASGVAQSVTVPDADTVCNVVEARSDSRLLCPPMLALDIDWSAGTAQESELRGDEDGLPGPVVKGVRTRILRDGSVAAYRDGALLWRRPVGRPLPEDMQLVDGLLLTGSDSVALLDIETGNTKWSFDQRGPIFVDGATKTVFVVAGNPGQAFAIDAGSGQVRWSVPASIYQPGYANGWLIVNDPSDREAPASAFKVR
jgi:outer membrane protein assembly factor BamB